MTSNHPNLKLCTTLEAQLKGVKLRGRYNEAGDETCSDQVINCCTWAKDSADPNHPFTDKVPYGTHGTPLDPCQKTQLQWEHSYLNPEVSSWALEMTRAFDACVLSDEAQRELGAPPDDVKRSSWKGAADCIIAAATATSPMLPYYHLHLRNA